MLIPLGAAGPPSEPNVFLSPKATYSFASNGTMKQLREPDPARDRQSLYSVVGESTVDCRTFGMGHMSPLASHKEGHIFSWALVGNSASLAFPTETVVGWGPEGGPFVLPCLRNLSGWPASRLECPSARAHPLLLDAVSAMSWPSPSWFYGQRISVYIKAASILFLDPLPGSTFQSQHPYPTFASLVLN